MVVKKLFELFTFTIYIRVILESLQLLLLSSVSEVYQLNFSNTSRIISYQFAILVVVLCIGLMALTAVVSVKRAINSFFDERGKLDELFGGLKQTKRAHMYNFVLMTRRFLFIIWLLCFEWVPAVVVVCIFMTMQLFYTLWVIYARYFDIVKDNIVEIYNECIYLTLLILLTYFRKEDRWNDVIIYVYMGLMMSCAFFLLIVSFSKLNQSFIVHIAIKVYRKFQGTEKKPSRPKKVVRYIELTYRYR